MILIATEKSVIRMFREKSFPGREKKQNGLTEKWWLWIGQPAFKFLL